MSEEEGEPIPSKNLPFYLDKVQHLFEKYENRSFGCVRWKEFGEMD